MTLGDAVGTCLDGTDQGADLTAALGLIREEFGVDAVSVIAFDGDSWRLIANDGEALIVPGSTSMPVDLTTSLMVTAEGRVYRGASLHTDRSWSRPVDCLLTAAGFRSACSVPLLIGSRAIGALGLITRETSYSWDRTIDAVGDLSSKIALALHFSSSIGRPRILLCHEDELLLQGIAQVLKHELNALVMTFDPDSTSCVEDAMQAIDLVICGSRPGGQGLSSRLGALRACGVDAPVLVIDSHDLPAVREAALCGVAGYIHRRDGVGAFVDAVRKVRVGQNVGLDRREDDADGCSARDEHLTPRECSVLLLLERGLRGKQIAVEMGISESTAWSHARHVFAKLGVHSRGEAVYEARRRGLLDLLHAGARVVPVDPANAPG